MKDEKNLNSEESLLNEDSMIEEGFDSTEDSLLVESGDQSSQEQVSVGEDIYGVDEETKRKIEIEARKRYFMDPNNQAEILLQNYVRNSPVLINRSQIRSLRREYLKNAKKGKYKKMFMEEVYGVPSEESRKNFSNLND